MLIVGPKSLKLKRGANGINIFLLGFLASLLLMIGWVFFFVYAVSLLEKWDLWIIILLIAVSGGVAPAYMALIIEYLTKKDKIIFVCPRCKKKSEKVEDYHLYCPSCDLLLVLTARPPDTATKLADNIAKTIGSVMIFCGKGMFSSALISDPDVIFVYREADPELRNRLEFNREDSLNAEDRFIKEIVIKPDYNWDLIQDLLYKEKRVTLLNFPLALFGVVLLIGLPFSGACFLTWLFSVHTGTLFSVLFLTGALIGLISYWFIVHRIMFKRVKSYINVSRDGQTLIPIANRKV